MKNVYQRIGSRVREFRKRLSLTQEQLAEKLEITPVHINRIERASQAPSIKMLCRIADTLGVDVGYFFIPRIEKEAFDIRSLPLKELIKLLRDRPRGDIKLVLDMAKRVCEEFDARQVKKGRKKQKSPDKE